MSPGAGFSPLLSDAPYCLILGSMPSVISLQKQQYYAHPQNIFWWIMAQLYGFRVDASYASRVQQLTLSGVAAWDVLNDCERPGSLDSSIVKGSERVNDFVALLQDTPTLKLIVFNGGVAKQLFMRHCNKFLSAYPALETIQLPSTSPAYAAMAKAQKLQIWRDALFENCNYLKRQI